MNPLNSQTNNQRQHIQNGGGFFVEIIHTHGHKMLRVLVFEKGVSGKRKRKG